jgi:hypothetical protein
VQVPVPVQLPLPVQVPVSEQLPLPELVPVPEQLPLPVQVPVSEQVPVHEPVGAYMLELFWNALRWLLERGPDSCRRLHIAVGRRRGRRSQVLDVGCFDQHADLNGVAQREAACASSVS